MKLEVPVRSPVGTNICMKTMFVFKSWVFNIYWNMFIRCLVPIGFAFSWDWLNQCEKKSWCHATARVSLYRWLRNYRIIFIFLRTLLFPSTVAIILLSQVKKWLKIKLYSYITKCVLFYLLPYLKCICWKTSAARQQNLQNTVIHNPISVKINKTSINSNNLFLI